MQPPTSYLSHAELLSPLPRHPWARGGSRLPHGDTPIFLSQEDVFIQQTQDTKNPVIYAVFSASG